jgi:Flp pilus assembly protein TadD
LLAGVLAATVGWLLYAWQKPRVLRVRVYTDYAFRLKRADWEQVVRDRIAALNGIYGATGIRWELRSSNQADPTSMAPGLDQRRTKLAEFAGGGDADLLLGLAGSSTRGPQTASVVPFTHAAMIVDPSGEFEAERLARELSRLFGAPPEGGQAKGASLSPVAQRLIRQLRTYNFEHGTEELAGDGGSRAVDAMAEAYRNIAANPEARAHEIAATALITEHRMQPGIAQLRQAIKLDPKNASAALTLAAALCEDNDFNGATAVLRDATAANPGNARLRDGASALSAKTSHQPEALLQITEMVSRYPKDAELNALLGWLFLPEAALIMKSVAAFENARNTDPDSPSALRGLERADTVRVQALAEVERRREAVRQNPQVSDAHFNLGVAYMMAGGFDSAQEEFERVVALKPTSGKAHVNLALLHWLKHDYPGAEREVASARKAGVEPSGELVRVIKNGPGR